MVSGTDTGILEKIRAVTDPVAGIINNLIASLFPGKEELVVIAIALLLGWKWRSREYAGYTDGYDLWLKASLVIYLLLKILGLGNKLI